MEENKCEGMESQEMKETLQTLSQIYSQSPKSEKQIKGQNTEPLLPPKQIRALILLPGD